MKPVLYDWGGLNTWLFYAINGWHSEWSDRLMLFGTRLADHDRFPVYLALAVLAALLHGARQRTELAYDSGAARDDMLRWLGVLAVFSLGYVVDGWIIGWLKPWLNFPRPPVALLQGSVHLVGEAKYSNSLPSGHASFAMLVAASLWPILYGFGRWLAALFVLWVGVSRVAVGAHFPADVLAGYAKTLLVVLILRYLVTLLIRVAAARGSRAPPA